jgi:hypothetical protein
MSVTLCFPVLVACCLHSSDIQLYHDWNEIYSLVIVIEVSVIVDMYRLDLINFCFDMNSIYCCNDGITSFYCKLYPIIYVLTSSCSRFALSDIVC